MVVDDHPDFDFGADDFTIELWASFEQPGGSVGHPNDVLVGQDDGPGEANKWFFALGGGYLNFHINGPFIGPRFFPLVPFSPMISTPEMRWWYHLAVVKQQAEYTIYINGVAAGSATEPTPIPDVGFAPVTICQAEGLGYMHGAVDELTIYRRALSPAELLAIHDAGAAGKCIPLQIRPSRGGDTGECTVRVTGCGFEPGASVRLERDGEPDIVGAFVEVGQFGTLATALLDLQGRALGAWRLVVENPGGPTFELADAFTIEPGARPEVWTEVVGWGLIVTGRPQTFHVFYGNRGNVDATAVHLSIGGIPLNAAWQVVTELRSPEIPGLQGEDWASLLIDYEDSATGTRVIPLIISRIPAGATGAVQIRLTIADENDLTLRSWISQPFSTGPRGDNACLHAILAAALQCSNLVIPSDCVQAMLGAANYWIGEYFAMRHEWYHSSLLQLFGGLFWAQNDVLLECTGYSLQDFLGRRLAQWITAFRCGWDIGTAIDTCVSPEHGEGFSSLFVRRVTSIDPNVKAGPEGGGPERYVPPDAGMRYLILFENDPEATAPAQDVEVTDRLDPETLDLSSFELGPISFGDQLIVPPPGLRSFDTEVTVSPVLNVRISAALNAASGVVTWRLQSIDPATGMRPENPLIGLLPPNLAPPEGEGALGLSIDLVPGLFDGQAVENGASIVFDLNAPIGTPVWRNTVDGTPPVSSVEPLPGMPDDLDFLVSWSGSDQGSSIASFSVYVSEGGGPFGVWLSRTQATSAVFSGGPCRTYAFYSIASDLANNEEAAPEEGDAVTRTRRLDSSDIFAFLNVFFAGDPVADYNSDGVINSQDFFELLAVFFAPCP